MTFKDLIQSLLPPLLAKGYLFLRYGRYGSAYGLSGNYQSWQKAIQASTGYDGENILEKTKEALLKVKSSEAAYERDSVLFDRIHYAWPLLTGLLWVAAKSNSRLNVLDFGGSLGSTYFQNRVFLRHLNELKWNVVEQRRHVEIGKTCFEDETLKFYLNLEDCLSTNKPNVIIASGVLQYLEHPYCLLSELFKISCNHIIIDRTPFWAGPKEKLCVQRVPSSIYTASYPSWIFSTPNFRTHLPSNWELKAEFDSIDRLPSPVKTDWKGMIIERRDLHR